MIIPRVSGTTDYRRYFPGQKSYFMGRWYVRDGGWRFSAPAYVSPAHPSQLDPRVPRVSARGRMVTHTR